MFTKNIALLLFMGVGALLFGPIGMTLGAIAWLVLFEKKAEGQAEADATQSLWSFLKQVFAPTDYSELNRQEQDKTRQARAAAQQAARERDAANSRRNNISAESLGMMAFQSGDELYVASRRGFPDAESYMCYIACNGKTVNTPLEILADGDGHIILGKKFAPAEPRVVNQMIPLAALSLPRNVPLALTCSFVFFSESQDYVTCSLNVEVVIRSGRRYRNIDWFRPMVDLMTYYSLEDGQLSIDELKVIKAFFAFALEDDPYEVEALKAALKQNRSARLDLNDMVKRYKYRSFPYKSTVDFIAFLYFNLLEPIFGQTIALDQVRILADPLFVRRSDLESALGKRSKYFMGFNVGSTRRSRHRQGRFSEGKNTYDMGGANARGRDGGYSFGGGSGSNYGSAKSFDEYFEEFFGQGQSRREDRFGADAEGRKSRRTYQDSGLNVERDRSWALEILGLSDNATQEDMKKAYRRLMAKYHPDRHINDPPNVQNLYKDKAQDLNAAKNILNF